MANCRRCARLRGIPFTGSGSASSHLAFDKPSAKRFAAIAGVNAPQGIAIEDIEQAFAEHGRLIAKPAKDGSSYGLIFVNAQQDIVAVRNAAKSEEYLIEPFVSGVEATCGVLEQSDGAVFALPPIEIVPAEGGFDYTAKYLLKSTQEICPGRFAPEVSTAIMDHALRAHRALSCTGYSRSDFIVPAKGPIYLETNTLPGLTAASLYPKALKAQGIGLCRFPPRPDRAGLPPGAGIGAGTRSTRPVWNPPLLLQMLTGSGQSTQSVDQNMLWPSSFTVCLPGSPKVNAGGACSAWLPGRELSRITASRIATRERGATLIPPVCAET